MKNSLKLPLYLYYTVLYYGVDLIENFFSKKYGERFHQDTAKMQRRCWSK
jgi:hypothetical protein